MADPSRPGLFASAKRLLANVAALGEVRLSLLANDLQAEKLRLMNSLSRLALALVSAAAGLALFSAGLLMLLQPPQRWWVMLLLGLILMAGAWLFMGSARNNWRGEPGPFDASLAELRRDKEALTGSTAQAVPPVKTPAKTYPSAYATARSDESLGPSSNAVSTSPAKAAAASSDELAAAVAALRELTIKAKTSSGRSTGPKPRA